MTSLNNYLEKDSILKLKKKSVLQRIKSAISETSDKIRRSLSRNKN